MQWVITSVTHIRPVVEVLTLVVDIVGYGRIDDFEDSNDDMVCYQCDVMCKAVLLKTRGAFCFVLCGSMHASTGASGCSLQVKASQVQLPSWGLKDSLFAVENEV